MEVNNRTYILKSIKQSPLECSRELWLKALRLLQANGIVSNDPTAEDDFLALNNVNLEHVELAFSSNYGGFQMITLSLEHLNHYNPLGVGSFLLDEEKLSLKTANRQIIGPFVINEECSVSEIL